MSSIIYTERHTVTLDGKRIGEIAKDMFGLYHYYPKGGEPGPGFASLAECKRSLED